MMANSFSLNGSTWIVVLLDGVFTIFKDNVIKPVATFSDMFHIKHNEDGMLKALEHYLETEERF